MIKAVVFDLDGVLIDATEWHYEALNDALKIFGYVINRNDHLTVYNGLPTNEKLKLLSIRSGLPEGLHDTVKKLKRKYTDEKVALLCKPDHEKQLLLSFLKKKGYRLAVCSNAQKYSVINMLQRSQLIDYFELVMGNDEGFKPKPSPDIYLEAFKRLKLNPKEVMIIEDAPHGVAAAKASGAHVKQVAGYQDVNLSLFIHLLK